jgi:hypothetical protein
LASTAGTDTGSVEGSSVAGRGGTLSPLRTSLALGGRPMSAAAARPSSAAGAGVGAGSSPGKTGLNLPLRRFAASSRPSTAPAADAAGSRAAADNEGTTRDSIDAVAGQSQGGGGSSSRRVSGGWFEEPVSSSPQSSMGQDAAAAGPAVGLGSYAGQQQSQQLQSPSAAGAAAGARSQAGDSAGSPARLGSTRRTRVSEQEQ